ncbi:CDK-activating kinase assembly factor MAT1-like, partial [Seriola lalandi dorsalis]|uniref:CDK-activating kinase assembly factor MAT1-like n=1 Tax=Seriola lalandi dorsalis TaxID=1841481 RepID=UPI000C6FC250
FPVLRQILLRNNEDNCSVLNVVSLLCFFFQRQTVSLLPVAKIEEVLYHYKPLQVETYGPPVPELEQLGRLGYLNHVRAAMPQDTAGGYTSALACHRAVQDAFSGLFPSKG